MALISSEKLNAPEDIQGAMGYFNNGNMVVIGGNYNRRKAFYTLHGAIINLEGEVLKPGAA